MSSLELSEEFNFDLFRSRITPTFYGAGVERHYFLKNDLLYRKVGIKGSKVK
jgi:hypothetical protein